MGNIPVNDQSGPGHQIIWDQVHGDKHVISDNGSRVDTYNGEMHSYGTYNQAGQWTNGGVGDTHPH